MKRFLLIIGLVVCFVSIFGSLICSAEWYPVSVSGSEVYRPAVPYTSIVLHVNEESVVLPLVWDFSESDSITVYDDNHVLIDVSVVSRSGGNVDRVLLRAWVYSAPGSVGYSLSGSVAGVCSSAYMSSNRNDFCYLSFGDTDTQNIDITVRKFYSESVRVAVGGSEQYVSTGSQNNVSSRAVQRFTFSALGVKTPLINDAIPSFYSSNICFDFQTQTYPLRLSNYQVCFEMSAVSVDVRNSNPWFFAPVEFPTEVSYPTLNADGIGDFLDNSVGSFFDMQILPGVSLGALILVPICVLLVFAFLRLFAGG